MAVGVSLAYLARNVHLTVVQTEGVDKILPESQELFGDFKLVGSSRSAALLTEACAGGLLNPDDVSQVDPSVGILDRFESAILPQERSVLL